MLHEVPEFLVGPAGGVPYGVVQMVGFVVLVLDDGIDNLIHCGSTVVDVFAVPGVLSPSAVLGRLFDLGVVRCSFFDGQREVCGVPAAVPTVSVSVSRGFAVDACQGLAGSADVCPMV